MPPLLLFYLTAFTWSWVAWAPLIFEPHARGAIIPLTIVGAFGPLVGALVAVRREGSITIRAFLRRFFDLRLGVQSWIVPVIALGGATAVACFTPMIWGVPRLPILLPSVWIFPPYVLVMVFVGGGQEEFGWRGYALERMESALGPWLGNSVLGLVWAVWHLPLWFVTGTSQSFMSFWGFLLLTQGYSFFFAWTYARSGKRPLSALWAHGLANAFVPLMPILVMRSGVPQPRFWIWVTLCFVVGLGFMVARTKIEPAAK